MADAEQRASMVLKFAFRVGMNIVLVFFLDTVLSRYFVLSGGWRAVLLVGFVMAILNWLIVPLLHIVSLPIKLFAWVVAFFLVNAVSLWIAMRFVAGVAVEGIALGIEGGFIGWLTVSLVFGFGNWLVKALLK